MKFSQAQFAYCLSVVLSLASSTLALPANGRRAPMPAVHTRTFTRTVQPAETQHVEEYHTYTFTAHRTQETEYIEWEDEDGWGLDLGLGVLKRQLPTSLPDSAPDTPDISIPEAIPETISGTLKQIQPYVVEADGIVYGVFPAELIPDVELQANSGADGNNTVNGTEIASSNATSTDNSTQSYSASASQSAGNYFMNRILAASPTSSLPLPSGFAAPTAPLSVLPPLLANGVVPTTTPSA